MGLPLSLPGVQESCAVLSVISSTDTLLGGPGGPKSMRERAGWASPEFSKAFPHHTFITATTLPLIKCYVLGMWTQGLFTHSVWRAGPQNGIPRSGKRYWLGSFMRQETSRGGNVRHKSVRWESVCDSRTTCYCCFVSLLHVAQMFSITSSCTEPFRGYL